MKSRRGEGSDIGRTLEIDQLSQRKGRLRKRLIWAVAAVSVVAAVVLLDRAEKSNSTQYKTEEVQRGRLTITVTATGTLEPTNKVDVGSELSGIVKTVEVDYNDTVKVGQVLARLDTDKLQAEVLKSKAALESARARLLDAQATVKESSDELARMRRAWELSNGKVPSQRDLDAADAGLQRAKADEESARAQVSEAMATLQADETDLSKAVIRSPINGIVLLRNVEPGQTVAASLQAPVLFTLAEDLAKMELHVDVDEADVGQVRPGQDATFTVDAYPDSQFPARIVKVYYAPQVVQDVVTYQAVLKIDNSKLLLRPGMTATAEIITRTVEDALLAPNGALRFTPPEPEPETSSGGLLRAILPGPRFQPQRQRKGIQADKDRQLVWTLREKELVAIPVTVGSSDGRMTEVVAGDVKPGLPLLVDVIRPNK